ncbi:5-oxoprolinase subunit PxpA [Lysinibacillus sp. FSL K6-0232]|uniref:LamB/YcsF family protein n=1 Tax=unclassified Lysinibacillus TaxID=2636778 RepID=UPI0030F7C5C1
MGRVIDIISDLGEGFGLYEAADDASIIEIVSSASVACGFHAGDPRTMALAVNEAIKKGVGVGAHPGFPDLLGFGRRNISVTPWEVKTDVLYQLGALDAFVRVAGGKLQHICPHGSLGDLSMVDTECAAAMLEAVIEFNPSLVIVTQTGELERLAREQGMKVAKLIFADRAYNDDGTLVSRRNPNAVLHDKDIVIERCVRMVLEGKVTTITGKEITVDGESILIHGDTVGSLALARDIKAALIDKGVEIKRLADWL